MRAPRSDCRPRAAHRPRHRPTCSTWLPTPCRSRYSVALSPHPGPGRLSGRPSVACPGRPPCQPATRTPPGSRQGHSGPPAPAAGTASAARIPVTPRAYPRSPPALSFPPLCVDAAALARHPRAIIFASLRRRGTGYSPTPPPTAHSTAQHTPILASLLDRKSFFRLTLSLAFSLRSLQKNGSVRSWWNRPADRRPAASFTPWGIGGEKTDTRQSGAAIDRTCCRPTAGSRRSLHCRARPPSGP